MITPSLQLYFTAATLDPRITFTRAGATATRVNSSGLIETVAADTARFDFSPTTLACRGLLVEEYRQNLWTYSDDFSNAAWNKLVVTISANATTAPDGTSTADKIIKNSGVDAPQNLVRATASGFANVVHAASIFVKAAEWKGFSIFARNQNDTAVSSFINLETQTVPTNNHNVTINEYDDGWLRINSLHRSSTGTMVVYYSPQIAAGINGIGDGTSGVYIWGAQVEVGTSSTSYIPTTTTALTRNADVATITGINFSDFWQASKGGVLVRARSGSVSGTRPWLQFDDGTADNIIALRGNTTNPELYIRAAGVDQATIDAGTIAANTDYRLAGSWKVGNGVATLNGFVPVKGTPASIPAVTQARLGSDGTNYLNGHLQSIEYWNEFLTPATLQSVATSAGYRSIIHPVLNDTIITEPV